VAADHNDVHLEEEQPLHNSSHCSQEELEEPEICFDNEDEECKRLEAEAHAE
jgi:hypothetical protein